VKIHLDEYIKFCSFDQSHESQRTVPSTGTGIGTCHGNGHPSLFEISYRIDIGSLDIASLPLSREVGPTYRAMGVDITSLHEHDGLYTA